MKIDSFLWLIIFCKYNRVVQRHLLYGGPRVNRMNGKLNMNHWSRTQFKISLRVKMEHLLFRVFARVDVSKTPLNIFFVATRWKSIRRKLRNIFERHIHGGRRAKTRMIHFYSQQNSESYMLYCYMPSTTLHICNVSIFYATFFQLNCRQKWFEMISLDWFDLKRFVDRVWMCPFTRSSIDNFVETHNEAPLYWLREGVEVSDWVCIVLMS